MNQTNHTARIDTRKVVPLHRAVLVDGSESVEFIECHFLDDACAPEGACCRDENQGRGQDCPDHPRAEDALPWLGPMLGIASILLVALVAAAALVLP